MIQWRNAVYISMEEKTIGSILHTFALIVASTGEEAETAHQGHLV